MKKMFRDNGLSLVLAGLFLAFLAGQAVTGFCENNGDQKDHGYPPVTFSQYLSSGHFWESVFENWESEFLQMSAYVLLTVFLYQKGSSESKDPEKKDKVDEDPRAHRDDAKAPGIVRQGGFKLKLYEHSLSLALAGLFAISLVGHAIGGAAHYNKDRLEHGHPASSLGDYVTSSRFWFEAFQNWQSEFLAVLAIVVLSIWLRERGSPESKPVAAPHSKTGG